jgi:23S rRNA (adenine2030-N6)-methyltransferase
MNYRHAFHAGNFADVVKHVVLARILFHLGKKDAPFRVIDTHSGIGLYDLAGDEAARTGEWHGGIGRIRDAAWPAEIREILAPYFETLEAVRGLHGLSAYPGSPLIAQHLSRAQDRLIFIEKHPKDVIALEEAVGRDVRAKVIALDGWTAFNAYVPPKERRGLVLVDPPFEEKGEFDRMVDALAKAHRKWPTGIYALWYPLKNPVDTRRFLRALQDTGIPKMLRIELAVRRETEGGPLAGTGMIVVNPPWTLADEMRRLLPHFCKVLRQTADADWISNDLTGE